MLCSNGGCGSAIATRCWVACGKFSLDLITRHLLSKVCGKVYTACIHRAMHHSRKTWGLNASELQVLHCNDCFLIHWICCTKDWDEIPKASLLQKLGIGDLPAVLRSWQLRWSGYVQCATSFISSVTDLVIPGTRGGGRPRKTWCKCGKNDEPDNVASVSLPTIQRRMESQCATLPGAANPIEWDKDSTLKWHSLVHQTRFRWRLLCFGCVLQSWIGKVRTNSWIWFSDTLKLIGLAVLLAESLVMMYVLINSLFLITGENFPPSDYTDFLKAMYHI